jgi:DnaJ-class molecular chaperone
MDYYNTLNIKKTASSDEIRKAYKKMSMKHHPDRGGDEVKFKEINQAYQTLSNAERKQMYDQYGTDDPQQMGGGGGFGQNPFGFGGQGDMNDMFSQFFGQGFGGQGQRRAPVNRDIQIVTDITLEEAFSGCNVPLKYQTGSRKVEQVSVELPGGVQAGQTVRYKNLGDDADNRYPRGDLLVKVRIKNHAKWIRQGSDLYCEENINVFDMMLGCHITIKLIDGKSINLKIPAGTNAGAKFNVPNKGMPNPRGGQPGNAIIIVKPIIPSIDQPELREQLSEIKNKIHLDF